jgi:hypothetical protein
MCAVAHTTEVSGPEAAVIIDTISFITKCLDCFSPSYSVGTATGSVVAHRKTSCLLTVQLENC